MIYIHCTTVNIIFLQCKWTPWDQHVPAGLPAAVGIRVFGWTSPDGRITLGGGFTIVGLWLMVTNHELALISICAHTLNTSKVSEESLTSCSIHNRQTTVPILTTKPTTNKKFSYCRDSVGCVKLPFKVTQGHPLLCQLTRQTSNLHSTVTQTLSSTVLEISRLVCAFIPHYSSRWNWKRRLGVGGPALVSGCPEHGLSKQLPTDKQTSWQLRDNFIKIGPLWMIFHRMHRHLIADWLRWKSSIWVECHLCGFHGNNSTMQECVHKKPICNLNWSREWLKWPGYSHQADFKLRPSFTGPLTGGGNDSRPVSRLKDSILNSCCNLYFRLLFIVCIDSKFSMIEKSRHNDWRMSILL